MDGTVCAVFKDPNRLLPEHSMPHKGLPPPLKFAAIIFDPEKSDGKVHLGGDFARSKIRRIISEFVEFAGDKIFVEEDELERTIVIDVKYPRIAPDARQHRPLEVLHQKGHIVTMLCRPDPKREMGIIFKFCPKQSICDPGLFKRTVRSFNTQFEPTEPISKSADYHPLNQHRPVPEAATA